MDIEQQLFPGVRLQPIESSPGVVEVAQKNPFVFTQGLPARPLDVRTELPISQTLRPIETSPASPGLFGAGSVALMPIVTELALVADPWLTSELPPILAEAARFQRMHPEKIPVTAGLGDPSAIQQKLGQETDPLAAAGPHPNLPWAPVSEGTSSLLVAPSPRKELSPKERLANACASLVDRLLRIPKKVRLIAGVAAVTVVAGLSVGVSVLTSSGPGWAAAWDPVVLPLAEQTAQFRGLKFLHPVRVEFLESTAFDAAAVARDLRVEGSAEKGGRCWTSVDGGPKYPMCNFSTPFSTEVHPMESAYRALGVPIDAPAPSSNSFGEIGDSLVLARYLPSEHLIEVRGAFSAGLAPTLVHELAHALQDQHFGLSFSGKNGDEALAYRALVEGDAMLTEYRYRFSLPEDQAAVIEQADTQTGKEAKARLSAVVGQTTGQKIDRPSAALQVEIDVAEFPYIQGTEFAVGQWKALPANEYNRLFTSPPKTTGSILYPGRDPHIGGEKVKGSPSTPGRTRYGKNDVVFGPLLFLVAMERTGGAAEGQLVASAWRGESTSIFQDRGSRRVCFSTDISFGGDSATLARGGLAGWASARGLSTRFVGDLVHLEGCDPFGTV